MIRPATDRQVWTILVGLLAAMMLHIAVGIIGKIHSFTYALTGLGLGFLLFVTVSTAMVVGRLKQRRPAQDRELVGRVDQDSISGAAPEPD